MLDTGHTSCIIPGNAHTSSTLRSYFANYENFDASQDPKTGVTVIPQPKGAFSARLIFFLLDTGTPDILCVARDITTLHKVFFSSIFDMYGSTNCEFLVRVQQWFPGPFGVSWDYLVRYLVRLSSPALRCGDLSDFRSYVHYYYSYGGP